MNTKERILFTILSGLLLAPAWYTWGNGLVLLLAFIPMLFVEYDLIQHKKKSRSFFWLPFLSFLIFNIITTWWVKNASFAGLIAALLVNSTMMTLPFWLFSVTHRRLGNKTGYLSLIFYWLAMEYFYLHAEISWTWLNLGNGFAHNIKLIQWYEFTGVLGGSLWILAVNLAVFSILKSWKFGIKIEKLKLTLGLIAVLILFPPIFSLIRYTSYTEIENPYEIVIIQPNIDPYLKFNDVPVSEQLDIFFRIADSLAGPETDYIVAPETFINDNIWLHDIESNKSIKRLREFSRKYPKAKLIIGITSYKLYDTAEESPTSRLLADGKYYDSFNTAIQIDTSSVIQTYHKSQLVVGVEKMPYTKYLGFLEKAMLHLGGTFRSHGTQDYRDSFISPQDGLKVGIPICYESIFGEFVTEYVNDAGANFIFVITNDGWWGDTPGYVQHNSFSALRAIENRRSIARSANTGISSFFDQKGEMLTSLGWWIRDGLKMTINANDKLSLYSKNGDYIGRISAFICIVLLLYTLVNILIPKK